MSQISDLGARALDHCAVGAEQEVELAGERRDIRRNSPPIISPAPRRIAATPSCKLPQRRKAIAQLQRGRSDQSRGKKREGDEESESKRSIAASICCGRRRDLDEINAVVAGIDDALDHAQAPSVRADRIALAGAAQRRPERLESASCGRRAANSEREL